jgi:hypothetical protein
MKRGNRLENLKESFKKKFFIELPIDIDQDYSTHVSVEEMIEIVYNASTKVDLDSYLVLKHFQFTDKEIENYFERLTERN